MHGEYRMTGSALAWLRGSPPHAWGIREWKGLCGNSHRDHPHMHGEYSTSRDSIHRAMGSPPHAWGIQAIEAERTGALGITPTCMGNTQRMKLNRLLQRDHPHMHGEYYKDAIDYFLREGSPPHAWGILPD